MSSQPPARPVGSAGRARLPDQEGFAERDGVLLAWAAYGSGDPTLLLLPTWPIVDSRMWKAQVPYLARHFRVITFDARGSGGSDRPSHPADYADAANAADVITVLDAMGVEAAVLVGYSCGVSWALEAAANHPERVLGVFALSPACNFGIHHPDQVRVDWDERLEAYEGWATYNKHYWRGGGFDTFTAFFFGELHHEPHSTKGIEDMVGWAHEPKLETLITARDGRLGRGGSVCRPIAPVCARVRCPVTVLHGTEDRVDPYAIGERLAAVTAGRLITVEGGGHGLLARRPVVVNAAIREFAEQLRTSSGPAPPPRSSPTRHGPGKRVLYISSPIGLGHARRDLAIAQQLRERVPGVQIDWLAQDPVTRVLADAGESIHPASAHLASESAHIEEQAGEHDLHAFQAIRRMDEILVNNFMVFADLVAERSYDLVVGDEAWDVDHFLHENPGLKRFAYAWLTDFVGWLPMPDGGRAEAALTADYNAEMLEQRARFAGLRDRSIFVGNPDDVVTSTFGPGLPRIRDWTTQHFDFAGYVTGFEAIGPQQRERLRRRHGYRSGEPVCVVAVGGSGVGEPLLRRVLDAVPLARRATPELRFVVVAGPRIDPARLPQPAGATVVGYQRNLYEHLSACDVAVVQGGLTTAMELAAANRPFLYVPLRHHFEQNFHVRLRLDNYRAGTCLPYEEAANPDQLADAVLSALVSTPACRPVETDGARRAASLLADLL